MTITWLRLAAVAGCSLATGWICGCGWDEPGKATASRGEPGGQAGSDPAGTSEGGARPTTAGGPGRAGASTGGIGQGGTSGVSGSGQPVCEDIYPYDDGYTCEQQAEWGKCDEAWLVGYCNMSCNRCGETTGTGGAAVDYGGARDVFDQYTEKQPIAPTPPMGWNSWNRFGCNVNEDLIQEIADAMVQSGMKDVGYQYVNIDDCWQSQERDPDGSIVPDPTRFPSGMKALADYVHDLGLKIGLYSDRGTTPAQGTLAPTTTRFRMPKPMPSGASTI